MVFFNDIITQLDSDHGNFIICNFKYFFVDFEYWFLAFSFKCSFAYTFLTVHHCYYYYYFVSKIKVYKLWVKDEILKLYQVFTF